MSLAEPGWLALLILLPFLAAGALLVARLRKNQWQAFAAPRLRGALIRRGSSLPRWLALSFVLLACGALIAALSRPQGDAGIKTEKTEGRNVLIALDLSRSMRVDDVKPDRLSQAKIAIYELIEALPQDRVGLIGFAGTAYLYAPLTIDHGGVRETVEQIDETWPSIGGSNLAEAIRLAIQTLKKTGQKNNALVILSDGEHHEGDLEAMINEAESSGVFIYAIGVGTESGGLVPPQNGGNEFLLPGRQEKSALSRLQPDVMRKLATETGGRFAVAGSGADLPNMIRNAVQEMDAFKVEGRERRISTEFFQWLLLPGIVFLAISIISGTRWRGIKAATAILAGSLLLSPQQASAGDIGRAKDALANNRYKEARETYKKLAEDTMFNGRAARYRLGEATAAYREKDFRGARSAFSEALLSRDPEVSASAHLGMGNTLFQLGWLGLTGEAYPPATNSPPDLAKFDEHVNKLLEDLQKGDAPENGNSEDFTRLEALIVNWADAVRHFDSSIKDDPANQGAAKNRSTTVAYLKRLRELLEQEKSETQQSMPQQGPGLQGQGPPQKGGEPGEGEGGEGDEEGEGEGDQEEDGDGQDGDKEGDGSGAEDNKDQTSDKGANPNESPQEHARRRLSENADLEKGPLSDRNMKLRNPEKDW